MLALFTLLAATLSAYHEIIPESGDYAYDHPSLKTSKLGCYPEPQYTCFFNHANKIGRYATASSDSGSCCDMCWKFQTCKSYNHAGSAGAYFCDLFSTVGPTQQTMDGCTSGSVPDSHIPQLPRGDKPNIVFLVVESTDGRTWSPGYSNDVIPLPNIRELQSGGIEFQKHYSNAPVCCPSRASFWSGRHSSNIPHTHNGIAVGGAWNNYEGLPNNFTDRIDQVLTRVGGYNIKVSGKTDWNTGGHTENVRLSAWTMYTPYPYDINASGGWYTELPHFSCASNGSVSKGTTPKNSSAHRNDWQIADDATEWIKQVVHDTPEVPFFVYSGMSIVHPPYQTNTYWSNKIDRGKVRVPAWKPLMDMHPCDFQSSMLKGCTPSDEDAAAFYSEDRRREVRSKYYAMIAEWDAMVGQYIDTVKSLGVLNETVFIVTSDHGDMQMEHQQHYKMAPYDASASVPMVIYDGRPGRQFKGGKVVTMTTQLIDILPTILELTEAPKSDWPSKLDGHSLVPIMTPSETLTTQAEKDALSLRIADRPKFVVSQFHGDNIAMSWFLVVQVTPTSTYKLIVWGDGKMHPSLLFDLIADPMETNNLIDVPAHANLVQTLSTSLMSVVDFPKVALSVAQYGRDSLRGWINSTADWRQEIHTNKRWSSPWDLFSNKSLAAVEAFVAAPVKLNPCRKDWNFGTGK